MKYIFGAGYVKSIQEVTVNTETHWANMHKDIPQAVSCDSVNNDWRLATSIAPDATVYIVGIDPVSGWLFGVETETQTVGWICPSLVDGLQPATGLFNRFGTDHPNAYYEYTGRPIPAEEESE